MPPLASPATPAGKLVAGTRELKEKKKAEKRTAPKVVAVQGTSKRQMTAGG
jgi:hypothetical protein